MPFGSNKVHQLNSACPQLNNNLLTTLHCLNEVIYINHDLPPKSGRRRMSYPFSSLSTVSFTKDILPGSFALKKKE